MRSQDMPLRKVALVVLVVAGAALGAAATGGFIVKAPAKAPASQQQSALAPVKPYDPLP